MLGPDGRRVEVQIRTREMHEVAERGVAAHWKYKEGVEQSDQQLEQWLSWVRDLLENPRPEQATEFVKEFRLNLYDEEIYVFTPKGDLLSLPSGATPVDFAFQVHTEVGFHSIGAKVNGKMVPLSYNLKSGDQVEVITSKKQTPNPDWMKFVVTHKARSRIRHWINEKRRKAIEHGREVCEKKVRRAHLELDEQDLHRYAARLKFPNPQQMYYEIGVGLFDADDFVQLVKKGGAGQDGAEEEGEGGEEGLRLQYERFLDKAQSVGQPALLIDGELHTDIKTHYASCCNPIPGDEVFGYTSRSGGIKIHRSNCRNAPPPPHQPPRPHHPRRVEPAEGRPVRLRPPRYGRGPRRHRQRPHDGDLEEPQDEHPLDHGRERGRHLRGHRRHVGERPRAPPPPHRAAQAHRRHPRRVPVRGIRARGR